MATMSKLMPREALRPTIKTPQELVHIRHKITLLQYKYWILLLRAYREAYEEHGADEGFCYLSMARIAQFLGYEPKTSEIERDLEIIRVEPIIFNVLEKDGSVGKSGQGFISAWYVSSNRVGVIFPTIIRDAIERLDHRDSIFHLLNWSIFNSFTGKYEAILYKLCKDYIGTGRTPYLGLQKFRDYMGIKETEYADFKRLNQWVIAGPVKKINESELADITIEPEFKRETRKIVGLWFRVTAKKQPIIDLGDHPAFCNAKVTISLAQQKKYLESKDPTSIDLAIQRANEYAKAKEESGKDVNLGGLYRKAIEEDWGQEFLAKKTREAEKQSIENKKATEQQAITATNHREELVIKFNQQRIGHIIKSLPIDERRRHGESYILVASTTITTSWKPEKATFSISDERIKFERWLRVQLAPKFDEQAFNAWLLAKQSKT